MSNKKGFTFIEILIVLGISTVLLAISLSIYFTLSRRGGIDTDMQRVVSALRLAQNRTISSNNYSPHGVHFDSSADTFTMFEGSAYSSTNTTNEEFRLERGVEFLSIQLEGGGFEVVFDRLLGTTDNYGFVELAKTSDNSDNRTICIEENGRTFLIPSSALCNVADLEYTDGTTNNDLASFPSASANGDPAQSFAVGNSSINISNADLYLRYNDDDTDSNYSDIFLEIRENSTTGNVLGKSLIVEGSSISTSLSWNGFVFPAPVALSASSTYFLRMRSLPDSTISTPGAEGTIIWAYGHEATAPSVYGGGDAWRYVGANNNTTDSGQQLGPSDQYDFSFRLYSKESPPLVDSRHLEFDLEFSLRDHTDMTLTFDGGAHVETITIADYMNGPQTIFDWEDTIDVSGNSEHIRIHSLYIDNNDTTLSVHRGRDENNLSLNIDIDTIDFVDYTAGGTPTKGNSIGSMIYR
ncbi:MAG: type II secretion system protein [Candidatus Spechtbacterales bacterium]|nr:type II secretion system protein [Candidatus Spechtbacterales bacterium]